MKSAQSLQLIDLTGRQPDWPAKAVELWQKCAATAVAEKHIWRTPPPHGDDVLRQVLAEHLGYSPERLVITSGVRSTISRLLYAPKRVIVEQPTFVEIPHLFGAIGHSPSLVAWDEVDRVVSADASQRSLVWVTSPARNPDSNRLSGRSLAALASLAANGHLVVQNEIYRWYDLTAPKVPGALLVGSLSKLAGGGARLGWFVSPVCIDLEAPELVGATSPAPWQRAWAYFIQAGGLALLHGANVQTSLIARDTFCQETQDVFEIPACLPRGPFVALEIEGEWTERAVAGRLRRNGILVGSGSDFAFPRPGLRLCFTDVTIDEAAEAATRLRHMMKSWTCKLHWALF